MRIGIDIDDTITNIKKDLEKSALEYAISLGKNINYEKLNIVDKHNDGSAYKETFGFSYDELKHFLKNIQEGITNTALPRDNAAFIINKLKEEGNEI